MEHKLFSELIVKLNVRPDFNLAKMVDDIDMPFRNIKPIKKDINNLFLQVFSDFMLEYNRHISEFKNFEVDFNSSMSMYVEFGEVYELTLKKVKKDCHGLLANQTVEFDDRILTQNFINEIDRLHILLSVVMGASMRKAISHIEKEVGIEMLQTKIIYDQIFEFWTKFYKSDFCYLSTTELQSPIKLEESEIELCLVKFFFNAYINAFIDYERYDEEQLKAVKGIINDTKNYRWYVIFGFWLIKRFEEKHTNILDLIFSDYKKVDEILDEVLNHS